MTDKTRDDIIAALAAPFDPKVIQQRSGLSYVEAHVVIRRLNEATGNTWNFRVLDQKAHPFGKTSSGQDRLMLTATVELDIPGLGARQHMGVQVVNESNGGEDLWKGAVTDALKKAATLFNVGIDLYGPDREAGEVDRVPARMQQPPQTEPRNAGATQTNATAKPSQDDAQSQRLSQGQLNVIQKHQKDLGWSVDDMKLIVAAHDYTTIKEFSADQGMKLIKVMSDPATADPYIALLRKPAQQVEMIPNSDAAAKARQ